MEDQNKKHVYSRRQFLRASALVATSVAAVACSPAAATTPASNPTAAGAAPAAEPTATVAAPAAAAPEPTPTTAIGEYGSGEPVILWTGLGGADGATFAEMLKMYTEKNAGKAVRSETYGWDTLYQKLPTATAAGTPPDTTVFHETEIEQFTTQGLLQPLDDIMYSTGLVPVDDFAEPVMKALTVDGKKMCVPFDNHGWVCYLNTKVVKDSGLDPAVMPKNGEEFIQWAQKVTVDESGKHPTESGFNKDKTKVFAIHFSWIRFTTPSTMRQFGGNMISDDKKKSLLDSEQTIAAVQFWHDLMYKYFVVPPAIPGVASSYDMYKTNSLAMMWDGSWSLGFFKDNPDVQKVSTANFLNSLAPDGKQSTKIGIHNFSIPVGVSEAGIKRAQDLLKWMSDNSSYWANSGQVPARLSVQKDATVQDNWETKVAAEQFSKIGVPDVGHKAYTEIQQTWEAAVSAALANTTPLKQAMTEGSQQVQAILDRP